MSWPDGWWCDRRRDLWELDVFLLLFLFTPTEDQTTDHDSNPHDQFSPINNCAQYIEWRMEYWRLALLYDGEEHTEWKKGKEIACSIDSNEEERYPPNSLCTVYIDVMPSYPQG
jgi:hypothetical protein